jgi:Uma2 family endonuclease
MARRHAVIFEDQDLRIPEDAFTYEGFHRWLDSGEFPETGRIDYLAGVVEIDMSPEDLYTHGLVKTAIAATLHQLVAGRLGEVYVDRARISSRFSGLSVEPDVVMVLFDTLKTGRVRYVPAAVNEPDRYSRMEGAPDLAVEVVSDGSKNKDLKRLPPLYAKTGIPELWLADARGRNVSFQIQTLKKGKYVPVEADPEGWTRSPQPGLSFRLLRLQSSISTPYFVLEHQPA